MSWQSGDGFVELDDGSVRWGIYGAAGVLFRHVDADGTASYFLAKRSYHTHMGGTWAVPGGALDRGEEPLHGALREFYEEIGMLPDLVEVVGVYRDDRGGWSYTTIVIDVRDRFEVPEYLHWETEDVMWVAQADIGSVDLFPDFRTTLGQLGVLES
jgi:8-oxo-dGTP diphosphatase